MVPIKPEFWSSTPISTNKNKQVILGFVMQPINKKPELYCWTEYGEEDNEIIRFATKQDILNSYYEFWKEKMVKVNKEHLINEENCIEDFCSIHYAQQIKPQPNLIE
jgi:hypothetical protein